MKDGKIKKSDFRVGRIYKNLKVEDLFLNLSRLHCVHFFLQRSIFFLRLLIFWCYVNLGSVLKIDRHIDLLFPQEIGSETTRNTSPAPASFQQEIM